MANKDIQYFSSGIARMNTQAGVRERLKGISALSGEYQGGEYVIRNLKTKMVDIERAAISGLLEAGMFIRKDMSETPPLLPVDTGALKASFQIVENPDRRKKKNTVSVELGWPEAKIEKEGKMVDTYAAYVHEMTTPPYGEVKWSLPNSGPKFFETALKRNVNKIISIIAKNIAPVV